MLSHTRASRTTLRNVVVGAAAITGLVALRRWYAKPSPPPFGDRLIDRFLRGAEFWGQVSVTVHASPAAIFRSLAEVTLADMPLAKFMGELRYLPARYSGQPLPPAPVHEPFLDLVVSGSGNIVLAAIPERELLLGSIGKFHDLADQQFVTLHSPHEFLAFDDPAYQKLAMSFRVSGNDPAQGCTLTLEHRTHALSPTARRNFALYWLGIKPGGNFVSWLLLRAVKRRAEALETQEPLAA